MCKTRRIKVSHTAELSYPAHNSPNGNFYLSLSPFPITPIFHNIVVGCSDDPYSAMSNAQSAANAREAAETAPDIKMNSI